MAYDLAKVTANGNNLIAQILANRSSLSIDKIEISDTQLSSTTDISTMTSVPKVVQTVSANGFSKNSNTLIISTVVDNSSISADYKAWVFGIWGSDSQNGQSQLIAVITSTNSPDTIPAFSGSTPVSYTYKFNIGFSNASQIQFNMSSDSFATNDTVIHTTGDETVDGKKAFKVDPVDGAGNAYAKTVDVNQQLDKKVTDNKDGTEQLNGVKVQPFNKLSDTIGGRNYLINTQNPSATNPVKFANVSVIDTSGTVTFSNGYIKLASIVSSTGSETYYRFILPDTSVMPLPAGTYTLVVDLTSSDNVCVKPRTEYSIDGKTFQDPSIPTWKLSSTERKFSYTFTIPSNTTGWYTSLEMYADYNNTFDNTGKSFQFRNASIQKGNITTDSPIAPEDKVNVSDMRKPASDVAGIEEVNAKQDKIGYTPADDSKVAHLSGANNFDTVPTVNNNPLLLASSLPSDLARTGSDQEFTGKNTFDTAPIDKTTGNPYITKDGVPAVPSTLADTTKPANFTAGLQSGGVSVATSDDLKSLENSAWHQLDEEKVPLGGTLLYKIDQSSKRIYMLYSLNRDTYIADEATIADFSSIVKNIKTISGKIYGVYSYDDYASDSAVIADLSIGSPASIRSGRLDVYQDGHIGFSDGTYFTYDDLQDAYK